MPENINIKSDEIVWIARGQAVVEARQPINNDCKVLSASATAVTTPSEVFAGEARYVGKTTFDCMVLVDGAVQCVTAVAEFSDKISSPQITAGTAVTLMPEVINVEATIENGTLKAVAVVDTAAVAVVDNEYACIAQPDDGIYAEKRTVSYSTACADTSEIVYVTDSVGAPKITDVLFSASRAIVTGAEASDGEIKVSGAVYTFAAVKTDDGTISSMRIVTPFVKSIAAPVHDGDTAFAYAHITDSSATLAGDGRIEIAATVRLNATALTSATAEVVTDVFCADNEIQTTEQTLRCITVEPLTTVIDTVDGQVPIEADRLAADNVLCVTGTFCTLTSAKIENERVNVEGLVGGDIIYYNAEKNAVDALAFRLPFAMPLANHTDATNVTAIATVTDVNVKIRRESVFDIKAEVAFTLMLSSSSECECIATVEKGEALARPDASVIIHIAKEGETLWQAAKALCCSPERVQQQNSATAPYSGGEKLINFCNK
ncbi:MAG: hypothetical protein K2M89_05785 [Clostridiales bacterium]|nr:hypothetical protein [Clostridiales bacterium]